MQNREGGIAMKKLIGILMLLALTAVTLAGYCAAVPTSTRTVVDMSGRTVTLPARINRVAVAGALNQMVLMLGSPDKIVATATVVHANPMFVRIYPKIKAVPAPFVIADANVEELLKTKPDVIFGGNDKLRELGLPVVEVSLKDPEEIKQAVWLVGKVLGTKEEKAAVRFCRYYEANMKRIINRTGKIPPNKRLKVYYAGNKLLSTDGKNSITDSWIEMAGGMNVAAQGGVDGVGRPVSMEDIIDWNPDVIVVTEAGARTRILRSDQWSRINAVIKNRVYINPKGVYLWSVRSGEEALQTLWVAKVLYPQLFNDLDLALEVKKFYKVFYKYSLSEAEVNRILNPQE
jgi:iron complex transport system substrate-binding protein